MCALEARKNPTISKAAFALHMRKNFNYRKDKERKEIIVACSLGQCGVVLCFTDKPLEPIDCPKVVKPIN